LKSFKDLIIKWKELGDLRLDLYVNKYRIRKEGDMLIKAYGRIKDYITTLLSIN